MDPKYRNCFRFFKKWEEEHAGRPLTETEKQAIYNGYENAKLEILKRGIDPDKVVRTQEAEIDGVKQQVQITEFDDMVEYETRKQNIQQLIKEHNNLVEATAGNKLLNRVDVLAKNIKALSPNLSDNDAQTRAATSSHVETNDSVGDPTPDKAYKYNVSAYVGDAIFSTREALKNVNPDLDYDDWIKQKGNVRAINMELYAIDQKRYNGQPHNTKLETSSREHFAVAKAFHEKVVLQHEMVQKAKGLFPSGQRQSIKVIWDKTRVNKMSREQFVEFVAPRLDPSIHAVAVDGRGKAITIDNFREKQTLNELAGQLYDQIQQPDFNWRQVGDKTFSSKEKYQAQFGLSEEDKSPALAFKNPGAFADIIETFTEEATWSQIMLSTATELGRQKTGLTLFGANPRKGFARYKTALLDRVKNPGRGPRGAQFETSLNFLEYMVRPELLEQSKMTITFSVLRNIQAGAKLGSAVITALMDIPTFITAGKRVFGLNRSDMIKQLFPGGGFNGTAAENRLYSAYVVEAAESLMDTAALRYILNDGIGTSTRIQRGAAGFANFIFKASGLNWWTRSLQGAAAGVYGKHIGELIMQNRRWDDLEKNSPVFVRNWKKYGIGKAEWEETLARHQRLKAEGSDNGILDARNRIDLYKMGEDANPIAVSLRQRYAAAIGDAVDTMVMKPGQFDRMSASLFADEHKWSGQLFKTILQFKAHPISLFRKIYARGYKEDKKGLIGTTAQLSASLMVFATMVVQLKQLIAGKEAYDPAKPDLYIEAFRTAGVGGIVTDLMMIAGGERLAQEAMTETKAKQLNQYDIMNQLLGPLLSDILKMTASAGGALQGGIRFARGRDNGELALQNVGELTRLLLAQTGFQNLWQTKLLFRGALLEPLLEFTDPRGYRRRERKAYQDARRQRLGGEKDNFIFRKLFD